ncbi:MAG: hypothetical protein H6849_04085 [Alphaproteobacteria bacterium]|nr:MAG: hypothetical protein H6849_04085 [Alphaproteobacteria bacterium]
MANLIRCYGCQASYEEEKSPGPAHPYIGAIPECWHVFTAILAKTHLDPEYASVSQITNDAYAAQHIGDQADKRANQSAHLHLTGLYLNYVKKYPAAKIRHFREIIATTTETIGWGIIEQPSSPHWMTVLDIISAQTVHDHTRRVKEWGESVWDCYRDTHEKIAEAYTRLYKNITLD